MNLSSCCVVDVSGAISLNDALRPACELRLLPEFYDVVQEGVRRPNATDRDQRWVRVLRKLWNSTLTKFLKQELEMKEGAGASSDRIWSRAVDLTCRILTPSWVRL